MMQSGLIDELDNLLELTHAQAIDAEDPIVQLRRKAIPTRAFPFSTYPRGLYMHAIFRSSFSTIVARTFNARLGTLSAKIRVEPGFPGDFICGTLIIKNLIFFK